MIVRTFQEAEQSDRRIKGEGWVSTRLLLKEDGMGFSFHITTIKRGAELHLHYTNHLESVYCIVGDGEIENCQDGCIHPIKPGTLYALDKNDTHILRATVEMQMACVFNPPLIGTEVHNAEGAYALSAERVSGNAR